MRPPAMVSARKRTASFGCLARAAPTAMAMTALLEIRAKVMNVIKTMLKTSVCLGHFWLIPLTKPYAIKNPAKVRASEMMKIHIMNLLQLVPNGDFPPPQSEASTRCCSAKVASINSLHLLSVGPTCQAPVGTPPSAASWMAFGRSRHGHYLRQEQ